MGIHIDSIIRFFFRSPFFMYVCKHVCVDVCLHRLMCMCMHAKINKSINKYQDHQVVNNEWEETRSTGVLFPGFWWKCMNLACFLISSSWGWFSWWLLGQWGASHCLKCSRSNWEFWGPELRPHCLNCGCFSTLSRCRQASASAGGFPQVLVQWGHEGSLPTRHTQTNKHTLCLLVF